MTYTDKDYFDAKFKLIEQRFDVLEEKMTCMNKTVFGNGHIGIAEQMRQMQSQIKALFIILVTMTPIYIKESRDAIMQGLLKAIGGI